METASLERAVCAVHADHWVSCSRASLQTGKAWGLSRHTGVFFPFFLFFQTLEVLMERRRKVLSWSELSHRAASAPSSH